MCAFKYDSWLLKLILPIICASVDRLVFCGTDGYLINFDYEKLLSGSGKILELFFEFL